MNRRDILKSLGLLTTHAMFPAVWTSFLSSCASKEKSESYLPVYFNTEEMTLLAELVDFIVPPTDTPGAFDAGVHIFIDKYVKDCLGDEEQQIFKKGLAVWNEKNSLSKAEKFNILKEMELKSHTDQSEVSRFVKRLKELTLLGFFFSKEGATAETGYVAIPGRFEGCIDLQPGQHAELLNGMT